MATDDSCVTLLPDSVMRGIPACQIWAKPLSHPRNNSIVVAVYNSEPQTNFLCGTERVCLDGSRSNCCMVDDAGARSHNITISWDALPLPIHARTNVSIFNLWEESWVKPNWADGHVVTVSPSDAVLFKISVLDNNP